MIPQRVAPVRPTPSWRGLLGGLLASVIPPRDPLPEVLEPWVNDRPVLGFSSGRAALYSAMRLAMESTGRHTIILPAYTSFSVAAAAARAGATIRLVDLDPATLDFDPEHLEAAADDTVAAIVLGNLFGFPSDAQAAAVVNDRGGWVIDDAAQALGARSEHDWVGTRGQLGVFSFGRGKCATTGDGGALVLRSSGDRERVAQWRQSGDRGLTLWAMAAGLKLAAGPHAFAVVSRMPGLAVGESTFEPDFEIAELAAAARGMAVDVVRRALTLKESRRVAAERWRGALSGVFPCSPTSVGASEPAYLRWPVMFPDRATRERAAIALSEVGMPFVRSYPVALNELTGIADHLEPDAAAPRADRLARCLLALPCHKDVTTGRVRLAAQALARVATTRNAAS